MTRSKLAALLVALLVSALLPGPVPAFKAGEFKTCSKSAFCTRLRGQAGPQFAVDPASVSVSGPHLAARLIPAAQPNVTLPLRLILQHGSIRLHLSEQGVPRFEVPGVLLPEAGDLQRDWTIVSRDAGSISLATGDGHHVRLSFAPPRLDITSARGELVASWNAEGGLHFEHTRTKQEGDPEGWWEETFLSHTDTKPRGPNAIGFDVAFPGTQHVYGLPERATSLVLESTMEPNLTATGEPFRLYNLDVFEYLSDSRFGLYGSIPFLTAHSARQTQGLFWLNAAEMYVDVVRGPGGVSTRWIAESGVVDLFFLLGPRPSDVTEQYAALTGGSALPQMFSLGYHQCRWNYKDEADVEAVHEGLEGHGIPYDVIWLDIEHTDGKRYFTWDGNAFPHPVEMQEALAAKSHKMVTIVDPHIKTDPNYRIFKEAQSKGLFVKDRDGHDYKGHCWPGESAYLDMLSPEVRAWWSEQFSTDKYQGSTTSLYIWNDMNEPSVFNGPEITMHKDARHVGGVEHRDVHNANGYFYHMATAAGLRKRGFAEVDPAHGDRPFVLSRAFFAGTQRVGAIWTGDNTADWDHLAVSIPMLLSLNLAGLPNSGADVGGFFGNPDPELLVRWYQLAVFSPFFRAHANIETKRREPWLFGDENTARIRQAVQARYRLLPQLYTLFFHANATGQPILRPLWWEFPGEEGLYAAQEAFMFGAGLLVAPALRRGAQAVEVSLPGDGVWYDGAWGRRYDAALQEQRHLVLDTSLDTPAQTFVRGGHAVTLKERPRRSTGAMAHDPITLVLGLDRDGSARGDLFVDDGRSFAFQEGKYTYATFEFEGARLRWSPQPRAAPSLPDASPDYDPEVFVDRIVILGLEGELDGWRAVLESTGGELETEAGPILAGGAGEATALVIRRPHLPVNVPWSITLSPKTTTA